MTEAQSKLQQRIRPLVLGAINDIGAYETAKGWLRYEALKAELVREGYFVGLFDVEAADMDDFVDKLTLEKR